MGAQPQAPVRRPRNRKAQIVTAATDLFCERGFHNVSMADVAGAVGITAGSLYRHFRNKHDLLRNVVDASLATVNARIADAEDIDELLRESANATTVRRTAATVWQREARHLPGEERRAFRDELLRAGRSASALVRAERPELDADDTELLAWAVLGVFGSVATHRVTLPKRRFEPLLVDLGRAVVDCGLGSSDESRAESETTNAAESALLSSRENLLNEAVRLFDQRGFQSVSTDEIGEAAGTSGPNIYKYYPSKTDLLVAAVMRAGERRRAVTVAALKEPGDAPTHLDLLLASYIGFAVENRHLLGVLVSELDQLPDRERRLARQSQRDYLGLWVNLLREVRPDLDVPAARIVVHAVLTVIGNLVRTGHVGSRRDLGERLQEICTAILFAGGAIDQ